MSTLVVENLSDKDDLTESVDNLDYGHVNASYMIDMAVANDQLYSFNLSSFVDNGTGDLTLNFNSTMTNALFMIEKGAMGDNTNATLQAMSFTTLNTTRATTFARTICGTTSTFPNDSQQGGSVQGYYA